MKKSSKHLTPVSTLNPDIPVSQDLMQTSVIQEDYWFFVEKFWGFVFPAITSYLLQSGFFEIISKEPLCRNELKDRFGWEKNAADALLKFLCSHGIIEVENESINLTERSKNWLCQSGENFIGDFVSRAEKLMNSYNDIQSVLCEGRHHEMTYSTLASFGRSKIETRKFMSVMNTYASVNYDALRLQPFFSSLRLPNAIDVGCGPATIMRKLLKDGIVSHAVLLDFPGVIEVCIEDFCDTEILDKIYQYKSSWRQIDLPQKFDLVLLSCVLNEEAESFARDLVQKSSDLLSVGGQVWVVGYLGGATESYEEVSSIFAMNMVFEMSSNNYDRDWISREFLRYNIVETRFVDVGGGRSLWIGEHS